MKNIVETLVKRDNISLKEAIEKVIETRELVFENIDDIFEIDEIIASNLGLEPDCLEELIKEPVITVTKNHNEIKEVSDLDLSVEFSKFITKHIGNEIYHIPVTGEHFTDFSEEKKLEDLTKPLIPKDTIQNSFNFIQMYEVKGIKIIHVSSMVEDYYCLSALNH